MNFLLSVKETAHFLMGGLIAVQPIGHTILATIFLVKKEIEE